MKQAVDTRGLLRCACYGLAPNLLHYCGPEKQKDLIAYLKESKSDRGLVEILTKFDTVKKYLTLLSENNSIDIFSSLVVDAYWIGSPILENINKRSYSQFLTETLGLRKKLTPKKYRQTLLKLDRALPCHNTHVFNIFMRTGHHAVGHTLETMDACRISWGKVVKVSEASPTGTYKIEIITQPLVYTDNRLALSMPKTKQVSAYFEKPCLNDWVTVHWNSVCEIVPESTIRRLRLYTEKALALSLGVL